MWFAKKLKKIMFVVRLRPILSIVESLTHMLVTLLPVWLNIDTFMCSFGISDLLTCLVLQKLFIFVLMRCTVASTPNTSLKLFYGIDGVFFYHV